MIPQVSKTQTRSSGTGQKKLQKEIVTVKKTVKKTI